MESLGIAADHNANPRPVPLSRTERAGDMKVQNRLVLFL
jgi:hypothetical protein